jgi:hypothetical protein
VLVYFLVEGLFVNNDVVSVNQVSFQFVGEDSFNGIALIACGHLFDQISNIVVLHARL